MLTRIENSLRIATSSASGAEAVSIPSGGVLRIFRRPILFSRPLMNAIEVSWIIFIVLVLLGVSLPAHAQEEETMSLPRRAIFLPIVTTVKQVEQATCRPSESEKELARLMATYHEQNRKTMNCNPILQSVARARAQDMAQRDYFSHTNPGGYGPNYLVRQAGYALPNWYDKSNSANNVESIAAGYTTAGETWSAWMSSSGHRMHLLGLHNFYAEQVEYGIAHYVNASESGFKDYWVVITAPPVDK